ncbi:MAG: PKD domain-containing protein [Bacteroidales bacterium]|nr:PKD domain-containing protein [Bacteroidales bacterium]
MRFPAFRLIIILGLLLLSLQVIGQIPQKSYRIVGTGIEKVDASDMPGRQIKRESTEVLELEYAFKDFTIFEMPGTEESYQLLRIEGFGLSDKVGSPAVPMKTEKIVIPEGREARVSIERGEYIEVEGINLYPSQQQAYDGLDKVAPFTRDIASYSINAFRPFRLAELDNEQTFRGVRVAYLQIRPVQYNPVNHTIRIYKDLKVTVEFVNASRTSDESSRLMESSAYDILNNTVLNKKTLTEKILTEKSATGVTPKGYLILTVPEFEAAADSLANWKRQMGYYVEVHSQSGWTVSSVKTLVASIYNGSSYDFEYLLLLGDHQHIPDYYMLMYDGDNPWHIYSTNYYACMDGSSDYTPEMAHGRMTVNSAEQAMLVVNKVINYEKNPPADPDFYTKGLHAGYFQDSTFDGTSDYRYCRTSIEMYDYMTARGFNSDLILYAEPASTPMYFNPYFSGVTAVPPQYLRSNGYPWDGNKDDILAAWNEGRLYAFHRDHGLRDQWMAPYFHLSHMDQLNNGDKLPIVFSVNCGTGKFDMPEPTMGFAEKLQRLPNAGAVGIIAATAETKSGFNDGLIIGLMDAIWSDPGIIPDLGMEGQSEPITSHGPIYTMGDVLLQGLLRMTETYSTSGWADKPQYHLYHYFGDPAMQVWTAAPAQMTAVHSPDFEVGATSLSLSGINAQNAVATITVGDQLIAKAIITNGSGTLTFPALQESVHTITLTISKHNFRPYIAKLNAMTSPVPDFEADVFEICVGDVVQFTDLSEGSVTSWVWDTDPSGGTFVEGTSSSSQNPRIRFDNPGSYSVSLTAGNPNGSETETKVDYIQAYAIPDAPDAAGDSRCSYEDIPELSASGSGIKWYADEELGTLLYEGSNFTPEAAAVGTISLYVTQTVNGCVSEAAQVELTTYPETDMPEVSAASVCEYDTLVFAAVGSMVKWYSDAEGTVLETEGAELSVYPADAGEYTYYASLTANGCESQLAACTVIVKEQPGPPVALDVEICQGDTGILEAEGNHIYWYAKEAPGDPLYFGNSYDPDLTAPGSYTYLLTQEVENCVSETAEVNFTINSLPVFYLGNDTSIYDTDTLLFASRVSGNYTWSDGGNDSTLCLIAGEYGLGIHEIWLDVNSAGNCSYSDTVAVEVIRKVDSLASYFRGSVISLFPNPTKGDLKLRFLQSVDQPVNLVITDPKGSVVYRLENVNVDPGQLIDIDVNRLSKGIYFVNIYNEELICTLSFIRN